MTQPQRPHLYTAIPSSPSLASPPSLLPASPISPMSPMSPRSPSPTGYFHPRPSRTPSPGTPGSPGSPLSLSPRRRTPPFHMAVLIGLSLVAIVTLTVGMPVTDFLQMPGSADSTAHITKASGGIAESVPLTLEARLTHLLARPALEQWEAELESRHECPFYTYSRNTYFFHDGKQGDWERVGHNEIRRYRSGMVDYLRAVERKGGKLVWDSSMEENTPKDQRRGIIYTGGEGKTMQRLRLSLHMLRKVVKSSLPVELYHFPGELEDPAVRKELVDDFDIQLVEIGSRHADGKSWHIKNEAFLATKFTEFVYMDSDNLPLADPALLFDSIEYKQSGSVFWADLNKDHPDNAIFRIVGKSCSDEHWPAESGQLIYDKRGNNGLNLAVLHLSNYMMQNPDLYGFLSYGDKDTYRYSFYALGLPYQQAPRLFASVGGYQTQNGESSPDYFCGHSMVQWGLTPTWAKHDPTYHPMPAFLHTILAKHRNGLQPEKLFSHVRHPRLDGIHEKKLVRTLYEFTGDCFAITLKGPDGMPDTPNSFMDGQGVLTVPMTEVVGKEVWDELERISTDFVNINRHD